MHNVVGMWFTPMVLGVTYWALPRMLGKPIYSYALGVLGFWTNMLFYTPIGAHHYIFAPIPWWLQTTAILFSVGMMVPVWSDGEDSPYAVLNTPETFHLDTAPLDDGPHVIRLKAIDTDGSISVREVPFTVRNGPGIAVHGIADNDVVRGRTSVLANAYSSTVGDTFEPIRIETPVPIPTWAWLLFLAVFAWGIWYFCIELHARNAELAAAATPTAGTGDATASAEGSREVLGEQVYGNYCAACHQTSGEGLAGVFPPLKGSATVIAVDPTEHARTVIHGLTGKEIVGVTYGSPMPPFAEQLSNDQIAAVVNHERTTWGNAAPTVTPDKVAALRESSPTQPP